MKEYSFDTATPLLKFLEENREHFVGNTLKNVFTNLGHSYVPFRSHSTDEPIMFLINDIYVIVDYYIPSDITIKIATLEEVKKDQWLNYLLTAEIDDEEDDEPISFMDRPPKRDIQNHKIVSVEVNQFSDAFFVNPVDDSERPAGGDYFGTISINLDNGVQICICGAAAFADGYIEVWAR